MQERATYVLRIILGLLLVALISGSQTNGFSIPEKDFIYDDIDYSLSPDYGNNVSQELPRASNRCADPSNCAPLPPMAMPAGFHPGYPSTRISNTAVEEEQNLLLHKIFDLEEKCRLEKLKFVTNYHGHLWELVNGHWHQYVNQFQQKLSDVSKEVLKFRGSDLNRNQLPWIVRQRIPVLNFRLLKLHYENCSPVVQAPCTHFGCIFHG